MAIVNVRVDCSPFGLGLPISLAGMEGIAYFPVGFRVGFTSFQRDLLAVVDAPLWWLDWRSYTCGVLSSSFYAAHLLR